MDRIWKKTTLALWMALAFSVQPCRGFGYEPLHWGGLSWTVGAGSARVDDRGFLVLSPLTPGGNAWLSADLTHQRGLTDLHFTYQDGARSWSHANLLDFFINFGSEEERIQAGSGIGPFRRFHAISFLDEDPAEVKTRYLGLRTGIWGRPWHKRTASGTHAVHLHKDEEGLVFYEFDRHSGVSSFLRNDEGEGAWDFDTVTIRLRDADRDALLTSLQHNGTPNPIPGGLWLLASALIGALGLRGLAGRKLRGPRA
jgi:hypothetical protein